MSTPAEIVPDLTRVIVIGTSGSGKTTFSRKLSLALGQPHIELDTIYWMPHWTVRPPEDYYKALEQTTSGDRWVLDGNYAADNEVSLTWPRATSVIWLNYPLAIPFSRCLRRTLRRTLTRQDVHHGDRESLRQAFFSRESILLWLVQMHRKWREHYGAIRQSNRFPDLEWVELRWPAHAEQFLDKLLVRQATESPSGPDVESAASLTMDE